jgi:transposase
MRMLAAAVSDTHLCIRQMQTETSINYQSLYEALQLKYSALEQELAQLKKLIFGSKHERFVSSDSAPSQLSLDIQAAAVAQCNITSAQKIEYTRVKKEVSATALPHPGRHPLPAHLERRETILLPDEDMSAFKKMGEEVTEELEYEPGKLFVNKIIRPKYAKANTEGVVIAPMPERPLPKAIAGAGLLAQIVIDKYVDHLPLYRQMERFKREGVQLPYSTISDWVTASCRLITPLYDALLKKTLQSDYLHADETPLKVLDKDKKGATHRGYYWVYHNSLEGLVLFDYQEGRGREGPVEILKDFKGHLQTDGYVAYDFFKEKEGVTVLHCMAHARRKFFEAQQNDLPRATYALRQMGLLYDIERKAKEQQMSEEQVLQLRRQEALPVLEALGAWMKEQYPQVLPKSAIGMALGYSIQRWQELMIYATSGRLSIDNNAVENSIRPVAIGRKNYLFAGSHEAAQRSAMLYSLMGTCKLHGINPFVWLKDVLSRIATHPINKIEELLPHHWQPRSCDATQN